MLELLAPAGSLSKLKTAILFGADAVYVGGEEFSLRTAADNFTREELCEGIRFAHERNKKVYVAVNIVPRSNELEKIREFCTFLTIPGQTELLFRIWAHFLLSIKLCRIFPYM